MIGGLVRALLAHRPGGLHFHVVLGGGVALVVQMLAHAYAQLHLHPAVLQVQLQRDQRIALALHHLQELSDLGLVQQQLFGPHGIGVEDVALLVGADVHALHKHFAVLDPGVALLQVHTSLADGFYFRAVQGKTAFVGFLHKVVVPRAAVGGHGLDALLPGHAQHLLSRVRLL